MRGFDTGHTTLLRASGAMRVPPQPLPPLAETAPAREERRLYVIDGVRLLAALLVAVNHYAGTDRLDRPGNPVWDRPVSEIMPTVFRLLHLRLDRRRDLLRHQRLRDLHVVLGPHPAAVLRLPGHPALPGVLVRHRLHHGRRRGPAGGVGAAADAGHPAQPHDAPVRFGLAARRRRLLDPVDGAALLSALPGGRRHGAHLPQSRDVLLRVGHRRDGRADLRAAPDDPDRQPRRGLVLHRRSGALPDVPVRPGPAAVGHADHVMADGTGRARAPDRIGRACLGLARQRADLHGVPAVHGRRRAGPHGPNPLEVAGHRGSADVSAVSDALSRRHGDDQPAARHHGPAAAGRRGDRGVPGAEPAGAPVRGAFGGPAAEAGPGHVVRPAAERDTGTRGRCRGSVGPGVHRCHRGTRTTPSWITDTASRPSCV